MPKVDELMAMGYSQMQAEQALSVTEGDLEQAVGFLLLGESSLIHFDGVATTTATATTTNTTTTIPSSSPANSRPGSFSVKTDNVLEIMNMGYSRDLAQDALEFSGGDLDRAIEYLLLRESHLKSAEVKHSYSLSIDDDATMAALLQVQEAMQHEEAVGSTEFTTQRAVARGGPVAPRPDSTMYHATTLRTEVDVPRMVVSPSFLTTDGAGPFCACAAASKFLDGGVVTAEFLNDVLQTGTELFRKKNSDEMNVARVLQKYGRSNLHIEEDLTGGNPKEGVHWKGNHNHSRGIRKLLAACRNAQPAGWQALILEVEPFENICVVLPPKGTKNKFWYIDCYPRPCFGVSGAHARVHSTLLQLGESLEIMLAGIFSTTRGDHEIFRIHVIKKLT
jgi:hypothetical protein